MAKISIVKANVEIPIFNIKNRSLKSNFMNYTLGKKIKDFNGGNFSVMVLNNINLVLSDGDRVGIVGDNGAGKSTLLRLISGAYYPTSGLLDIKGSITSLINLSCGVDYEATGRENIFIRSALLGFKKKEVEFYLDKIIEFSELGKFIDMPFRTYSSGMQLRLLFSICIMVQPEILLMDEWLAIGDESFKIKAESYLRNLINETKIFVIASHSQEIIKNLCNRVIWIENGQIIMDESSEKVCDAYFK